HRQCCFGLLRREYRRRKDLQARHAPRGFARVYAGAGAPSSPRNGHHPDCQCDWAGYIGIPVVMVCRPNSRSVAVSQGKGLTLAAAKASGVMESVEGYHAEHIALPLKYSSYEELRYSHQVADPEDLPKTCDSLFHPNLPLLWIETHDL